MTTRILIDNINYPFTFNFCAALTLDAICCLTCCNFCGGCCGRYSPFILKAIGETPKPGIELFQITCYILKLHVIFNVLLVY